MGMEAGERPAPPWRAGVALAQTSLGWLLPGQRLQPVGIPHAGAGKQQADPAGRSGLGLRVSWDSAVAFSQELQRSFSPLMLPQPSSLTPGPMSGASGGAALCLTALDRSLEKGMATYSSIFAWRIPWITYPDLLGSSSF